MKLRRLPGRLYTLQYSANEEPGEGLATSEYNAYVSALGVAASQTPNLTRWSLKSFSVLHMSESILCIWMGENVSYVLSCR
jgi:hypothetical protein